MGLLLDIHVHVHVHVHGFESHLRKLIFLGKVTALVWCVALPCCLFDLACFFLSSIIKTCTVYMYM